MPIKPSKQPIEDQPNTLGQSTQETTAPPRDSHAGAQEQASSHVTITPSSTSAGNPEAKTGDALIPGMGGAAGGAAEHDEAGREGGKRTRQREAENKKRAS